MVKFGWRRTLLIFVLCLPLFAAGCAPNMSDQPKYNPMTPSDLFADGRSARPSIPGTVPYGSLASDPTFYTGRREGEVVERMPVAITPDLLRRGRERFEIYCSPCHGRTGDGQGMVVRRGFRQPPSYFIPRLREAPDGHFFEVITNGFGEMYSYANRVSAADRWAITAYIRALQLSEAATLEDVPTPERGRLLGSER